MLKQICAVISLLLPLVVLAGPVDLNNADAETLAEALDGVGTARAQAIVDYRKQYGGFRSVDELLNVSGIGQQILDANRGNITVEAAE